MHNATHHWCCLTSSLVLPPLAHTPAWELGYLTMDMKSFQPPWFCWSSFQTSGSSSTFTWSPATNSASFSDWWGAPKQVQTTYRSLLSEHSLALKIHRPKNGDGCLIIRIWTYTENPTKTICSSKLGVGTYMEMDAYSGQYGTCTHIYIRSYSQRLWIFHSHDDIQCTYLIIRVHHTYHVNYTDGQGYKTNRNRCSLTD